MSTVSLQVTIAGRKYPLTVKAEEEAIVRQAEATIHTLVSGLQEKYHVKDIQDLLAMSLLQLASKNTSSAAPEKQNNLEPSLIQELEKLNALTVGYLV